LRTRASAALLKGFSLSAMALWVFGSTVYQTLVLGLPKAEVMGVIGVLALAANLASVLLLLPTRTGTPISAGTATAWPDLAVAAVMAGIFLTSSVQILRQSWAEYRTELRHGQLGVR
jgi:Co/Zn/Cd efflux system component